MLTAKLDRRLTKWSGDPTGNYRGYCCLQRPSVTRAVRLYFRVGPSFRDVAGLAAERCVIVTYEAIRRWCRTCGSTVRDGCVAAEPYGRPLALGRGVREDPGAVPKNRLSGHGPKHGLMC